jgi:hypothetical protein
MHEDEPNDVSNLALVWAFSFLMLLWALVFIVIPMAWTWFGGF